MIQKEWFKLDGDALAIFAEKIRSGFLENVFAIAEKLKRKRNESRI